MDPSIQTPASQCSTFPPLDRPVRPTQFTGSHCRFAHAGSKAPAPLRKTKHLHETRSKCGYAVTVFFFFSLHEEGPPNGSPLATISLSLQRVLGLAGAPVSRARGSVKDRSICTTGRTIGRRLRYFECDARR